MMSNINDILLIGIKMSNNIIYHANVLGLFCDIDSMISFINMKKV